MESSKSLATRLKEVLTEGDWVTGTNFKDQIDDLGWEDAVKSVAGLNSIAKLTFHIHYYLKGVAAVLEGGTLEIKDKYSFDAPPIRSKDDWIVLKESFTKDAEKFIGLVEKMTEETLQAGFVKQEYGSFRRNINVMIEHCYYHLGQVLIIKKLIKQEIE